MVHPAVHSPTMTVHVNGAERSRHRVSRLAAVIEVMALESLERETPGWRAAHDGRHVDPVIHAVDRFAAEMARELERGILVMDRGPDEERRRVEFGYD